VKSVFVGAVVLFVIGDCMSMALLAHDDSMLQDEVNRLANQQVVQAVQLQDARDRIHALEIDLDRIAPHTPRLP
jgi:hypothetical protein